MRDALTDKRRWSIRNVFLQKRASYSRREAARRLGVRAASLDQESYTWPELVEIAMTRATLAEIHEALGRDSELPRMLRLQPLTVKLPAYQIAMLRALAEMDAMPVDESLQRLLKIVAGEIELDVDAAAARDFPR